MKPTRYKITFADDSTIINASCPLHAVIRAVDNRISDGLSTNIVMIEYSDGNSWKLVVSGVKLQLAYLNGEKYEN